MDVLVTSSINALNGTTVKIHCSFTSCYKMDITKFSMNWTYQETLNDTEEMVKWLVSTYFKPPQTRCIYIFNPVRHL